ncbi:MAG: ParB N-terminal domain-containing protein [Methylocystis sp.]|uniref:ParB N-terminal domain-containing protein n=1 Tax=Methylocystis sp. TaxID=1911079 RepID=UPI003DA2FB36
MGAHEKYQMLPPLPAEQFTALKADIAQRGVMVAVEVDEFGVILDGHNRVRACRELGINDYPTVVRAGMTDEQKRTHARSLNVNRRQLTRDQMRELIRDQILDTTEWANNRIGALLGVDDKTVAAVRASMEATSEIPKLEKLIGADGKARPHRSAKPKRPRGNPEEWSAQALAPAFGGVRLSDAPDAIPDSLKLEMFAAGISGHTCIVMRGIPSPDPLHGLTTVEIGEWATFVYFLVSRHGWAPHDAHAHFEWLRRTGSRTVDDWLGPVGDRYRQSYGQKPIPEGFKNNWREFHRQNDGLDFDRLAAVLEGA